MATKKTSSASAPAVTLPVGADLVPMQAAPSIDRVAGPVLQEAIASVNRAYLNLMRVAALMGPAEPLAPALLDMPESVIQLFENPRVVDRMMDLSFGFPLVRGRIQDPQMISHMIGAGTGDAAGIAALTSTLTSEVIEKSTRRRLL